MKYTKQFPTYRPSLRIQALKISHIVPTSSGGAQLGFKDQTFVPFAVDEKWLSDKKPEVGGYFVIYPGGLTGFWQRAVFEAEMELVKMPASAVKVPANLSVRWYATPNELLEKLLGAQAASEGVGIEELYTRNFVCEKDDGTSINFTANDMLNDFLAAGCWAFYDNKESTIHAWALLTTKPEQCAFMLAREIGVSINMANADTLSPAAITDLFGRVAATAMMMVPKELIKITNGV